MPRPECCRVWWNMPIQQAGTLGCCDRLHARNMAQHCPELAAGFRGGHHLAGMRPMRQLCKGAWNSSELCSHTIVVLSRRRLSTSLWQLCL